MAAPSSLPETLRKALLEQDLTFGEFMELALYDPQAGYYAGANSPIGRAGDYITSSSLSPVFAFALARLCREFLSQAGDVMTTIVDIGCGDGGLIHSLAETVGPRARFYAVDRALARVPDERRAKVTFVKSIDEIPRDGVHLIISNELFDALPFARVVQRSGGLSELLVHATVAGLEWRERPAPPEYAAYLGDRRVELQEGQFADITPAWGELYGDICGLVERGLIVTFDYGFPVDKLFHPRARRFGTAAAYAAHHVSRDLLANPGEQDLTAHINFTDLIEAGERCGAETLFFDRQAKFLLGCGITEHELFRPVTEVETTSAAEAVELLEQRDAARQLVMPEGIGHDIRVLVQGKRVPSSGWMFQQRLF